ncbi:SPL family radical SAM protein [Polyangium mundeleinium]|uniref:Radical SAM protein n=1 Tax=Polyangium mundeleinium TaxID=2995306 RepID=A0ABT5EG58_9BACT|nr:radical SAM protein [Polyangium mundeleinium]MDC0740795.1 radical SAM protein [Polyangium mundeleinium]
MSDDPPLRKLDQIVGELLAPLLNARPAPGGWRLAGWDVEQGVCVVLARGDEWVLVEFESRDDTRDCYTRTSRFNVCARHQFDPEKPLSASAHRAVGQLVDMVRRREGALPMVPRPAPTRGSEVREVRVERALVQQGPGHYYLNPYVGCMIGCEFCYVADRADLSRELEGRAQLPWGRYVDVKVNLPEVLAREVATLPPGLVRMSPIVTDPYQPLEKKYRITRRCLEALVGTGFTPGVLTRAARIGEDAELLGRFRRVLVGLSIPTDDDEVRRQFEPGGDPIEERFAALDACQRAGCVTVAVVQPVLPMDPERLAARLAPLVRAVRIDRMYDGHRVRHLYEAAGRLDAATEEFYQRTAGALRAALEARGVRIDPLDDLHTLMQ